jgi:16S rRNA (guanine1207-N2)-methyltransferase
MEISPADLAWSVVERLMDAEIAGFRGKCVWAAQPDFGPCCLAVLKALSAKNVEIFRSFRPDVRAFESQGFFSKSAAGVGPFDLALCVPTRQRTESLALIAHGLLHLRAQGRLLFVCANTQGAPGFVSRLREIYPDLEAESSKKCRWVLLPPPEAAQRVMLEAWIREAGPTLVPETDFATVPGIYGWNKVDRGSELLLSTLPALEGEGADLGSGYGYLSRFVMEKNASVTKLHLVEADARALDCARKNLSAWKQRCAFHWLDATAAEGRAALQTPLDFVVMNPPFHEGTQVDAGVGRAFIETAYAALKPGGSLFLVANAFLGYEELLCERFSEVSRVRHEDGFKVIHALR